MSILPDGQIIKLAHEGMITPFVPNKERSAGPSFGMSSYGYDARLGNEFAQYKRAGATPLHPNQVDETDVHRTTEASVFLLYPGEFVLAHTLETFRIPNDVTALVKDKSTYARLGVAVQNTILEAGWYGQPTLEISNHNSRPVVLLVGWGVVQIQFYRGEPCEYPYIGKYQGQGGVTLPS